MKLPTGKEIKEYEEWGVDAPSHDEHDIKDSYEKPISEQLKSGNPHNWRMEGHVLYCDTDFGIFAQSMPTNIILIGTDDKGIPLFKEL